MTGNQIDEVDFGLGKVLRMLLYQYIRKHQDRMRDRKYQGTHQQSYCYPLALRGSLFPMFGAAIRNCQ